MIRWLLDTNVISEMRKSRPNEAVAAWLDSVDLDCLFTSSLNLAELRVGILKKASVTGVEELRLWVDHTVRPWLNERVINIGEDVFVRWRLLTRELQIKQLPAPGVDLLIAAVALEHRLHVATRDVKPFVGATLPVFNPWNGERFNGA